MFEKLTKAARGDRINILKIIAFLLSFIALGLCQSSLGPSLLDLQLAVQSDNIRDMAWLMPARMSGYALGSFSSELRHVSNDSLIASHLIAVGFLLYRRTNPFLMNSFLLLASAGLMTLTPYNRTLAGLLATLFANGYAIGMVDSIGNLTILHMFGNECEIFMQLLHGAFGFGGIIGPIIMRPFLLPLQDCVSSADFIQNVTTTTQSYTCDYSPDELLIQSGYQIVAVYNVCISALFLYLFTYYRQTPPHPSRDKSDVDGHSSRPPLNKKVKYVVVVLTTLFLHVYYGLEIAMASFLTTYSVKSDLNLSKKTGAAITSLYWSTFTFARVAAAFYSALGARKNIIIGLVLVVIANLFLITGGNSYSWCLWVGGGIIGTGMSSIWPSMLAYIEGYFPLTNKIASGFTVFACVGK